MFGVFDILHPGHLSFLAEARRHGRKLIVAVTRDSQAEAMKGREPYFSQRERLTMVSAIKGVDAAVLGDAGKKWSLVRRLKPDVICVGYDQRADHPAFLAQLEKLPKKPKMVRLKANHPDRYKSSKIISSS